MTKKDIGNLPFPEPGESICAEEDRRIAELEAEVERLKSMVNDMARWEAIAASYRDECDDERKYKHMYRAAAYREEVLSERIDELETALEKVTAERDKWRNDVRLMMEDDERDTEKMLQMLIAAGIDPNEDDLGYATSIKAVVDATVKLERRAQQYDVEAAYWYGGELEPLKEVTRHLKTLIRAVTALTKKGDGR